MNDILFQVAAASIKFGIAHDAPILWTPRGAPEELHATKTVFCSLRYKERQMGCMGVHNLCLFDAVRLASFRAAFRDLRFPRVNKNHLQHMSIQLHILEHEELPVTLEARRLGHTITMRVVGLPTDLATLLPQYADPHVGYTDILTALRRKGNVSPIAPNSTFHMVARATESSEFVALKDIPPLTTETRE